MKRTLLVLMSLTLSVAALAAWQPSPDDERRAAITVMRAINTAEHAVKQQNGGKYVELPALMTHQAMQRVKDGLGSVRLTLTPDASGYQAMVVPAQTCGTAVFSDERGFIYAGKVLDC